METAGLLWGVEQLSLVTPGSQSVLLQAKSAGLVKVGTCSETCPSPSDTELDGTALHTEEVLSS